MPLLTKKGNGGLDHITKNSISGWAWWVLFPVTPAKHYAWESLVIIIGHVLLFASRNLVDGENKNRDSGIVKHESLGP